MTTTLLNGKTTTSALGGTVTLYSTLNDDGSVSREKSTSLIATTAATGITALGGYSLNEYEVKKIYEEYATAYIDSMSDEELQEALVKLDLLEAEMSKKNDMKTI